jgi:hypothetical protein
MQLHLQRRLPPFCPAYSESRVGGPVVQTKNGRGGEEIPLPFTSGGCDKGGRKTATCAASAASFAQRCVTTPVRFWLDRRALQPRSATRELIHPSIYPIRSSLVGCGCGDSMTFCPWCSAGLLQLQQAKGVWALVQLY